tara:strand:+ start:4632 stop:5693 length:1062 start_codon:yes stop_codon:yes gene_type:complete
MAFGFSSSKQESNQNARTFVDPDQKTYLNDVRSTAAGLTKAGLPEAQVAGLNSNIDAGVNNQAALGGSQVSAGNSLLSQGQGMTSQYGNAMGFANNATNTNNTGAGIGASMAGGRNVAGDAAQSTAAVNQGFDQSNLDRYINNDVLQGQIDASTRDVGRVLNEQTLTGIQSSAAGTGNSGSSRAGIMAGVAVRGAQDRAGDIAANMRGQAYNNALNLESGRASQNAGFNQQTNLANSGAFNQMYGAGLNAGTNSFNQNQQNQQFGATLSSQLGTAGVNNMVSGGNLAASGFGNQVGAGEYSRGYEQEGLDNSFANAMNPFAGTEFYNSIIGGPTVLSESSGSSSGKSTGFSFG